MPTKKISPAFRVQLCYEVTLEAAIGAPFRQEGESMVQLRHLARFSIAGVIVLAGMAAIGAAPVGAATATLYVATSGTNSGNCQTTACATIGYALTQGAAGDTISVGPGTFDESQLVLTYPVTIEGTGSGSTTIDVTTPLPACTTANYNAAEFVAFTINGATTCGLPGASAGSYALTGVTLEGIGGVTTGPSLTPFLVSLDGLPSGTSVNLTGDAFIANSTIDPQISTDFSFGIYASNPNNTPITLSGDTFSGMFEAVLLEASPGTAHIDGNTFTSLTPNTSGSSNFPPAAVFLLSDGGGTMGGGYSVSKNIFSGYSGYGVVAQAGYAAASQTGTLYNVSIANNTFNLPAARTASAESPLLQSGYSVPVGLFADSNGSNALYGIQVTGNSITSSGTGAADIWAASVAGNTVSSIAIQDNALLGGSGVFGVNNTSGTLITATDNWWGSSTGPTATTNSGGTGSSASADVTFNPWLAKVSLTPSSQTITVGSSATVQATLLDSNGTAVGAVFVFTTAPNVASTTITSAGAASFTFSDSTVQNVTVDAAVAFAYLQSPSPLILTNSATVDFVAPPPPPGPTPPPPPPGTVSYASGTSTTATGTASATNDNTTVTASGVGALTVAQYASDPVGPPSFSSTGEYFDVQLSSGNSFTATTIKDCNLNGGNSLQWWNPQANAGAGAWEAVSPTPSYTAGPPACVAVTLSSTTSPTLAELTGTVFGVATTGSAYTALAPKRLLDTRTNGGTLGPNSSLNLTVTGGSIPSDATAVAVNVTVTNTTAASYLSVYPAGGSRPVVSNLNWVQGETVPNLVIVPVGSNGQVTIYNYTGNANVVVDLEGYFAPEAAGSTAGSYVPLTPARITDTRSGSGYPNAGNTLAAGGTLNVQVTGKGGVPSSGVTGAILNVTVTNTTAASYLTAYPEGTTRPLASNLNWGAGETVANRVVVPVSSSGMITLYNYTGSTDVVVDVSGYFTNGSSTPTNASLYNPITPVRVLDTRLTGVTLSGGATLAVPMAGVDGIASNATAVVTNVTAANTTAASFFTVYPGGTRPTSSDVNWMAGQVVSNLTLATLSSTGSISIYNHAGSTAVIVDAFGYFIPG